ncbi:arginase family protein [Phenylobacterium kunshanense]|uniref:Agmatinase n=1 Tax=Phenylobacterium kunshanense TaxID=1445034 RepID=A0A328BC16_9CAUL|nr:arginase family protein [Phenylobacterium kunshanense]RAK63406.1 agmatinase [Phenylobacterium kunshanense]
MTRVALLGLPTDQHSSFLRGSARAPGAIREALHSSHSHLIASNGVDVAAVLHDVGDVQLREDAGDFDRMVDAVRATFAHGPTIVLGGDHAITYPVLAGMAAAGVAPPRIVHIDAHPDLYDDFEGDPLSHASPFARILERGLASGLTQLGIRTVNAHLRDQIARFGVRAFAPDEHGQGLAALPAGPTYISIDLDGLDPAFAPGVSHHEPGGLTTREVLDVIWKTPGPVIGGDIVELNPDRDIHGMTATLAAKLVKELAARISADATSSSG